jgi:hypothetical protein
MATIEEAIVTKMLATSDITDLIGSGSSARLYPLVVPQTAALPAIAYQKIIRRNRHRGRRTWPPQASSLWGRDMRP